MDGHELHEEDLRLMYTFDQTGGGSSQFEAHSDSQVSMHVVIMCCGRPYSTFKTVTFHCHERLPLNSQNRTSVGDLTRRLSEIRVVAIVIVQTFLTPCSAAKAEPKAAYKVITTSHKTTQD